MENFFSSSSSFISILGLVISIISILVSYLSYQNTKKATLASERSAIAAEKSLITTRPFIKLSNPIAGKNIDKTVALSVQITNFGTLAAEITEAQVDVININGEGHWIQFPDGDLILYPGDTHTVSLKTPQVFTIEASNAIIDYLQVDPGTFVFEIFYSTRNDPKQEFTESVSFPNLQWTIA